METVSSNSERRLITFFLLSLIVMISIESNAPGESKGNLVVGWVEKVSIHPGDIFISAKLDTGAVTCSLHAADITEFQRDGQNWVKLRISDCQGTEKIIECPALGARRIKRHFGRFQKRLVVSLGICLGSVFKEVDVNLVDRTGFEYPMLIGRNFMEGDLLVNPSVKFTVEPACSPRVEDQQPVH